MYECNVAVVTSLIQSACHKRRLHSALSFGQMGFTMEDMLRVNQVVYDKWRHHSEIYLIDNIESIVRIITGNFNP